jgi:hypothetical protein
VRTFARRALPRVLHAPLNPHTNARDEHADTRPRRLNIEFARFLLRRSGAVPVNYLDKVTRPKASTP